MTKNQQKIMDAISSRPDGACRHHMPMADRASDKARQSLRRKGVIVYEDRGMGKRWFLTRDLFQ